VKSANHLPRKEKEGKKEKKMLLECLMRSSIAARSQTLRRPELTFESDRDNISPRCACAPGIP